MSAAGAEATRRPGPPLAPIPPAAARSSSVSARLLGPEFFDPRIRLREAGGMVALYVAVVREAFRPPYLSWWRNAVEETWTVAARCMVPLCLSLFALGFVGVNPIRAIVLPRVIALTIVSPLIAVFGVFVGYASGVLSTAALYPGSSNLGGFLSTLTSSLFALDIASFMIRTAVFGLIT